MQHFFFMSSIPRSGSTVLAAILNQNPNLFVTPTSPLLDLMTKVEGSWKSIPQTSAWYDPQQKINVCRGIFRSIYEHIPRPYVIDKHRAWIKNIPTLNMMLGYPAKFIFTVRDLDEVTASYMILVNRARESGRDNFIDARLRELGLEPTVSNSVDVILGTLEEHFRDLHMAMHSHREQIHLIEYNDLLSKPEHVVQSVYQFLQIPPHAHEFQQIQPLIEEDDTFWGLDGLHKIRPELKRASPRPAEVLGEPVSERVRAMRAEFWRQP